MKLTSLSLLPFITAAVIAAPNVQFITPGKQVIDTLSVNATVVDSVLIYRTCPRISCTEVGQYPEGTMVTIECETETNTTTIDGDQFWAKLDNGYYGPDHSLEWTGLVSLCELPPGL